MTFVTVKFFIIYEITAVLYFVSGKPPPTVSWLVNDKLVTGFIETNADDVIVNRLEVPRVTREMVNATFKCQASNSKLTLPLEKSTRLELHCKKGQNMYLSRCRETIRVEAPQKKISK